MQPLTTEQTGREVKPARTIMIAGNQHHWHLHVQHQPTQHVIQQFDRFRWRHRTIINIAGNDQNIGPMFPAQIDHLIQRVRLIFGQMVAVKKPAQMPVGCVNESQDAASNFRVEQSMAGILA